MLEEDIIPLIIRAFSLLNVRQLSKRQIIAQVKSTTALYSTKKIVRAIEAVCVNNLHRSRYIQDCTGNSKNQYDVLFKICGSNKDSMYELRSQTIFETETWPPLYNNDVSAAQRMNHKTTLKGCDHPKIHNTLAHDCIQAFPREAHLRDYFASNISSFTVNGERLTLYRDVYGRNGVEYVTGVGIIDILAHGSNGSLYVFEFKLTKGIDRVIGQICRYIGWVRIHLAGQRNVYGVVIAKEYDSRLFYACAVVPDVFLIHYRVAMQLTEV